ncbi:MAG: CDP-alcohol phosphatidyltransferase family protein [Myxococcales bacterium]|nr:CDP-alcohol phosphatidyltransferase family protein [Myxococcales bacterium]USN50139.1 MAG: CDP-alcohol phosphatidyltransferase family protein [Myxococcales bacterium]
MRITANQVTMARIFLLPIPSYMLIYGDAVDWWIAFALFIILGTTDFIDGLMARKEGPTRLGSLLDPVADKIFVTAIILSMIALEIFPAWVASALLSRELLMTALRSSVAFRREQIKTSKLGKLKTIIQMGGFGTIFLTIVLPYGIFTLVCLGLSLPFITVAFIYRLKKKTIPFWVLPVFCAFFLVGIIAYFVSKETILALQMGVIISITWISAIDYVTGSYKLFRRTGINQKDWARIMWAIVHGLFVAPLVAYFPIMVIPLLVSMSLEFGLGGIDNIAVSEKYVFSSWPFWLSAASGLLFALWLNAHLLLQWPAQPLYLSIALAIVSSLICGFNFGRHVELFKKTLL